MEWKTLFVLFIQLYFGEKKFNGNKFEVLSAKRESSRKMYLYT